MNDSDRIDKLYDAAQKQIDRAWRAYATLAALLIPTIGAVLVSFYFVMGNTADEVSTKILEQVRKETKDRIDLQLAQEFQAENISALVVQKAESVVREQSENIAIEAMQGWLPPDAAAMEARIAKLEVEKTRLEQELYRVAWVLGESLEVIRDISEGGDSYKADGLLRNITSVEDRLVKRLGERPAIR